MTRGRLAFGLGVAAAGLLLGYVLLFMRTKEEITRITVVSGSLIGSLEIVSIGMNGDCWSLGLGWGDVKGSLRHGWSKDTRRISQASLQTLRMAFEESGVLDYPEKNYINRVYDLNVGMEIETKRQRRLIIFYGGVPKKLEQLDTVVRETMEHAGPGIAEDLEVLPEDQKVLLRRVFNY